jgi:hypothetical protein
MFTADDGRGSSQLTVTASNQAASNQAASNEGEVGSGRAVKAAAPSAGLTGSAAASAPAAQRPAILPVCGLVFVILIEAAWAGLLCFVVLRLIVR